MLKTCYQLHTRTSTIEVVHKFQIKMAPNSRSASYAKTGAVGGPYRDAFRATKTASRALKERDFRPAVLRNRRRLACGPRSTLLARDSAFGSPDGASGDLSKLSRMFEGICLNPFLGAEC